MPLDSDEQTGSVEIKKRLPEEETGRPAKRRCESHRPKPEIRFDGVNHWPELIQQKQRCKLCIDAFSRIKCDKCGVALCLNRNNNCFKRFHIY